ncbi:hypothetical protein Bca52824_015931 [Brassica carinata]|uniref:Uncharacterized protein n=1 Tax=Brassica carinata TaxID=52824 RepID=A0A8X8B5V2_BRACI|nr:hypothetical protein Bca52824_015931 [Brassica carinata]
MISSHETIYCPHPLQDPLCVQPQQMCYHQRYRLSSIMALEALDGMGENKPDRYRSVGSDRLGHNKSVTAQYAPPDLSVEAQHRLNEESVKERTIEPLEDPTHKEAVTPTDVDYSQQEENRHERDLDPLGRGRKKT